MEKKLKHLEFIQNIIARMAKNSFLLKWWSITITTALIAISIKEKDLIFLFISIFPIIIFWFLDSYFLKQEKLYRKLYDEVRLKDEKKIDFSLKTNWEESLCSSLFSITLLLFYVSLIIPIIIFYFLIK